MTTENVDGARPDTPPPASAPPPAEQADPERPDPSADLQPGGFLDQVLGRSRLHTRETGYELRLRISLDLDKMRRARADPSVFLVRYTDVPAEDVPRRLVAYQDEYYQTDAVLRYCCGQRWRIEDKDGKLRSDALEKYLTQADDYETILGDFIPKELQRQGRAILAEARYDRGGNLTAADDWAVYRGRLRRRRGRPLLGVPSGLGSLDLALGGLRGLTFLGGGPGVGKSALALFIAANALRKSPDLGVLYYSLDMAKTVVYDRLLSQEAGVDYGDLVAGAAADGLQQRLDEAEQRLGSEILPRLRVAERLDPAQNEPLARVVTREMNEFLTSGGVSELLVVVDYFQLLPVPDTVAAGLDADFNRVGSLQEVQRWTRTSWNPAGFPILAISEVRKADSGRTAIGVGDLMGSARLGYSADSVLLLESRGDAGGGQVAPVRLRVAKGRDGAVRTHIDLLFDFTRSQFREAAPTPAAQRGGKPAKERPARKSDRAKIDPLAGMEG